MASVHSPKTLEDLQRGKTVFGNSFAADPNRPFKPVWLNEEKFIKGQEFFKRFVLSVCVGFFMALLVGFAVPPLAEAVLFTNNSTGAEKSRKRYLATLAHIYSWHISDIFDPTSKGYASLKMVRNYHDLARARLQQAVSSNTHYGGEMKITQYDMALVQAGFIALVCNYAYQFGIDAKDDDYDDYRYFWRVIGYTLGMDDEYNMCGGTLRETRYLCKQVEQIVVVPNLENMEPYYVNLSNDFIEGMKPIMPLMDKNLLYAFIFPLMNIQSPKLGFLQSLQLLLMKLNFWLLRNCSLYRRYLNFFILQDLDRLRTMVLERLDF